MKARKGILSKSNVLMATSRGKRHVNDVLSSAKRLSTDEDRAERIKQSLCPCCFYLNKVRIGGAAMTTRECASCDKEMLFSSTATNLLCLPCASENKLCMRCGADIELKERRKPYLFEDKYIN